RFGTRWLWQRVGELRNCGRGGRIDAFANIGHFLFIVMSAGRKFCTCISPSYERHCMPLWSDCRNRAEERSIVPNRINRRAYAPAVWMLLFSQCFHQVLVRIGENCFLFKVDDKAGL